MEWEHPDAKDVLRPFVRFFVPVDFWMSDLNII